MSESEDLSAERVEPAECVELAEPAACAEPDVDDDDVYDTRNKNKFLLTSDAKDDQVETYKENVNTWKEQVNGNIDLNWCLDVARHASGTNVLFLLGLGKYYRTNFPGVQQSSVAKIIIKFFNKNNFKVSRLMII